MGFRSNRRSQSIILDIISVLVSLSVAHLNLNEWAQAIIAASLYVSATLIFSWPPLEQSRLVVGLVLGLKAQILFFAPFTAAFSRLIGGHRVTNGLTTLLCLAPLIGAALGTAIAPLLIPYAGQPLFMLTGLPSVIGTLCLLAGWRYVGSGHGFNKQQQGGDSSSPVGAPAAQQKRRASHEGGPGWTSQLAGPPDLDSPMIRPQSDIFKEEEE